MSCALQEGLEYLIPLPEIVLTVESLGLERNEHVVSEVAETLLSLLRDSCAEKMKRWETMNGIGLGDSHRLNSRSA